MDTKRILMAATLATAFAGCGGGGSSGSAAPPAPVPAATPTPSPVTVRQESTSTPLQTTQSNPGVLPVGSVVALIVSEPGYSGNFTSSVQWQSVPSGSQMCITGGGDTSSGYFFVGASLNGFGSTCLYPQEVQLRFSDAQGRYVDLFLEVVSHS
jgi:hypothetical protein